MKTVSEVIEMLSKFPPNMAVFVEKDDGEFTFHPVAEVKKQKIKFIGGGKPEPKEDVVLLSCD